ncbi:di-heme-cytochrome C peroxidase [Novipirellula sp. SH528]|uniref:di-heme-cytochrome C peroxidase n=1 Tax=Novipirellula sp. SH528 TaxID=3454466 RepID=UPI003F9F43B7
MLDTIRQTLKARLPFVIATAGEFIALYYWLLLFDQSSYLLATIVLWAGFLVERIAVLYWVKENFGGNIGIAADHKPWWQKLIGLLLICLSEITVWVLFVFAQHYFGWTAAFLVLFVGEQIEHSIELGLLSQTSWLKFVASRQATVITVLETLGGVAWLYLVRHDQAQLGGMMLLIGLTIEHVIQGDAIKRRLKAKQDQPNEAGEATTDASKQPRLLGVAPVVGGIITVIVAGILFKVLNPFCFRILSPPPTIDAPVTYMNQNWSAEKRDNFYHASQGTVLMKADWFMALEQPTIKFVGRVGLMSDQDYLARFGFLKDDHSGEHNSSDLPVGFAVDDVTMPHDGSKQRVVGLTCAACHTGEIHYADHHLRIDGAAGLIDLEQFQNAVGAAFLLTIKNPLRFNRFADRVLGEDHTPDERAELKESVNRVLQQGLAEKEANASREIYDGYDGGYGRTDALAKIANFVFGTQLDNDNLQIGSAPVRFPPLWDSPWFDWAQYNGSVEQPMVRNIGEAIGVRARVNLDPRSERFLDSTVDIEGLHEIETMLSGDAPLQGLHSPRWPEEVMGAINNTKAAAGAALYRDICQTCHLPALDSDEIWEDKYWVANNAYSMSWEWKPPSKLARFLNLEGVNIGKVGTDPGQATNFFSRYVNTGKSVLPSVTKGFYKNQQWENKNWYSPVEGANTTEYPATVLSVGEALQRVTVAIAQRHYERQGWSSDTRESYDGYRNPGARNPLEYRPRPLNGIWASPPYLHNGSVRTIYQLLCPPEERDRKFYVGTRQYDAVHLGYKNEAVPGAFLFDTRVDGNLNTGHAFDALPLGNGVIGPRLTHDERMQILEYLKTLGPAGPVPESFVKAGLRASEPETTAKD